jgi:dienelactone hydrolase
MAHSRARASLSSLMKAILATLLVLLAATPAASEEWLVAGPLKGRGRACLGSDPILEMMSGGEAPRYPKAGDAIGETTWRAAKRDEKGGLAEAEALGPMFGVHVAIESASDRVALLFAHGAGSVWVNGEMFTGDVYGNDAAALPVALRRGENHLVARCVRGKFAYRLEDPPAPVFLYERDVVVPSAVGGSLQGKWGAVPIVNATNEAVRGATLEYGNVKAPLPTLPPRTALKIPFVMSAEPRRLRVVHAGGAHEIEVSPWKREEGEAKVRTFRSGIDRSVQYYGVRESATLDPSRPVALVLSLHGAGVGADRQADAYTPRDGFVVVAPTNRRPFGFNWEDWGRLDGLEVLEDARKRYRVDESRVYLTGHSMGGHGTWHFAATYPDRWAAAAPSAGWVSLWTYPGEPLDPAAELAEPFRASASPSHTLGLVENLRGLPVFVIHGDRDDNVPIAQARLMEDSLKPFHRDVRLHVAQGQGHWWDDRSTRGADCVNLEALFDFFSRRRRPEAVTEYEFRTYSPAVSSSCREIEVVAQERPYVLTRVAVGRKYAEKQPEVFTVATENAAHIRVRRDGPFLLDGTEFAKGGDFHRDRGAWVAGAPAGLRKTPRLHGPFAQAFHAPFLLVVPTAGDPSENAESLARARQDSLAWWYIGSGRGPVVYDAEVKPEDWKAFNLVLYGSAAANLCWKEVAAGLPFAAEPGEVRVEGEVLKGDLALAGVYPSPRDPRRLIAVVGASGPAGRRAWNAFGWWGAGAGTPDVLVWGKDVTSAWAEAIRVAGIYGADWKPCAETWTRR